MRVALALATGLAVAPAAAQEWNCADTASLPQMGMNHCAWLDFEEADRALNLAWPIVVERMKATDAFARDSFPEQANGHDSLLKAQRAWIDYRDGHCTAEGAKYAGGSLRPLIEATCKTHMTQERMQELLLLLEEG